MTVLGTKKCDECGGLGYAVSAREAIEDCAGCDGTGAITVWGKGDPPLAPTPDCAAKAERVFKIARAATTPAETRRALEQLRREIR